VFGIDMIHNIAFRANWDQIQNRKQDIINKSNQKENKNQTQISYEYKVGDQVLVETPGILRNGTIRNQNDKREIYQKD
jgi:hypothetical protein